MMVAFLLLAPAAMALDDLDGDGFSVDDCDDADASIHPGADELCNAVDDDCDAGTNDDGVISVEGYAYTTIQDAIDAATSGATVSICAGTYFEHLVLDEKSIVLEGMGPDLTILDGDDSGTIISEQHGSSLTVRSMTFQHGSTTANGGAIEAQTARYLAIEDCVLTENYADGSGGAVFGPVLGSAFLTRVSVTDNDAGSGGGVVLFNRKYYATVIDGSEFRGNHAVGSGGALGLGSAHFVGRVVLRDTIIDGNTAETGVGGGIAGSTGLELEGVVISNNQAASGGGVHVDGRGGGHGGRVAADDATEIFGNSTYAGGYGGGVYFRGNDAHPRWNGGHIHDNTAAYGGGVAITILWGQGLTWAVVENNHATDAGGGVWISGSEFEGLDHDVVRDNTSDGSGGGLYFSGGGGLALTMDLHDSVITGNVAATEGGGVMSEFDFVSSNSNWGEGAVRQNSPDDVGLVDTSTGDTATFTRFGPGDSFWCSVDTLKCVDR